VEIEKPADPPNEFKVHIECDDAHPEVTTEQEIVNNNHFTMLAIIETSSSHRNQRR
jgi:hypothetical protein